MSARLPVMAGYTQIPATHKLVLMKICDSADDETRIGYPGIDAVRVWSGASRSRALALMAELQDWGLIMQTETAHRGRRAEFKVFPSPGDEEFSVAARKGLPCPGAQWFKGPPGIPTEDEVAELAERLSPVRAPKKPAKGGPDAGRKQGKGPTSKTLSTRKGSNLQDPIAPTDTERVQPARPNQGDKGSYLEDKGSCLDDKGSWTLDPFYTNLPTTTTKPLADADASTSTGELFDAPPAEERPPANSKTSKRPRPKSAPKAPDPIATQAREITAAWWDSLPIKPTSKDAFRNTMGFIATALRNGRSPESTQEALIACGVSATGNSLDYQFERLTRERPDDLARKRIRPAQSDQDYWANGGGFNMPA